MRQESEKHRHLVHHTGDLYPKRKTLDAADNVKGNAERTHNEHIQSEFNKKLCSTVFRSRLHPSPGVMVSSARKRMSWFM